MVSNEVAMIWNVNAYLENLREIGWDYKTEVLVYHEDAPKPEWEILKGIYRDTKFFFYKGDQFTKNVIPVYLPIIRPYCLKEHFAKFPELENETIVYTDADILWLKRPDIRQYTEGCYVSSTVFPSDYQSHDYLLSKRKDVDPTKLQQFDKIDVLDRLAKIVGITKDDIIDNHDNCGGVQYILNKVNAEFWYKVMIDCLSIRVELQNINQQFMKGSNPSEREINGYQSWCADLWSVFYNLLYFKHKVEAPDTLSFSWASDNIARLSTTAIFHNAGITSDEVIRTNVRGEDGNWIMVDAPVFYKGKYLHSTPFKDIDSLKRILENPVSKEFCSSFYTQHLIKLQEKYNLNY